MYRIAAAEVEGSAAGLAMGAAHALHPALFLADDVSQSKAYDDDHY